VHPIQPDDFGTRCGGADGPDRPAMRLDPFIDSDMATFQGPPNRPETQAIKVKLGRLPLSLGA